MEAKEIYCPAETVAQNALPASLAGCPFAPGFNFADFELANAGELFALYPQREVLIKRLIR